MSYSNALQLLRLADLAASRHLGVTLAAEWRFHPTQETRRLPDGRLEVRFTASGWLEMAWHLHCWGESVEVIAPDGLKEMIALGPGNYAVFP